MKKVNNKLRVYHYAQVPCKPFIVEVEDEIEAMKIVNILAKQHLFLFDENIIPDYTNVISVVMYEENEWVDYWNEEEEMEWSNFEETYFNEKHIEKLVLNLAQQTFHHSHETAKPIVDKFIVEYPELLIRSKRWLYKI